MVGIISKTSNYLIDLKWVNSLSWREFNLFLLVVIVLKSSNLWGIYLMNYEFLYVWISVDNFLTAGIYAKALGVNLLFFFFFLLFFFWTIMEKLWNLNSFNQAIQIWITWMDQNGSNYNFFMFCQIMMLFKLVFTGGVSSILKEPLKKK